jgi:D-alanyl-D-alanine carboxypeptidase
MNMSNYNTGSGNGYGGIYSTVYDMQVFIEKLFRDKTMLSSQSLQTMLHFTPMEEEQNRAFGITVVRDFMERDSTEWAWGHRGRDLAYSADLFYFPHKDITMAYLVNYGTNGSSSLKQVFFDFRKELVDELMKP